MTRMPQIFHRKLSSIRVEFEVAYSFTYY